MWNKTFKKEEILIFAIQIFLILLLLQVPLIALFKYKLQLFPDLVWLWKEALIAMVLIRDLFMTFKHPNLIRDFLKDSSIKTVTFWTIILWIFALILAAMQPTGILGYILFLKYDIFYLILFLSTSFAVYYLAKTNQQIFKGLYNFLLNFTKKWLPTLIILSFFWYILIFVKPSLLTHIGYQKNLINSAFHLSQPIAAQKTEILYGFVRNQFVFELPLGRAFFLTAFFPLYFVAILKKLKLQKIIFSWSLWLIAIVLTFSRAAIATFLLESLILFGMFFLPSKKYFKKLLIGGGILILLILPFIYKGYTARSGSNTWHFIFTYETRKLIQNKPLVGRWPWSSGAASHQLCKFKPNLQICTKINQINKKGGSEFLKWLNPENHYLQIRMELGIIGFLIWLGIHLSLLRPISYLKTKWSHIQKLLGARSFGLAALLLQSLVLHPLSERIVAYFFMAIGWIIWGLYLAQKNSKDFSKVDS